MVCLLEPFSSIGIFSAQVPEGAVPRTDPSEGAQKRRSRADQGLQQDPSSISIRDVVRVVIGELLPVFGEARSGICVSLSLTSTGERFVFVDL